MYRTRQIRIRRGGFLWAYGTDLCRKAAVLYNRANFLVRQYATAVRDMGRMQPLRESQMQVFLLVREVTEGTRYEPKGAWLNYGQLDLILKTADDRAYRALPAQANQQILKRLLRDYKSFFAAEKVWKRCPERFTGRPKLPGYKKKDSLVTAVLTNQICRIRDGRYLKLPGTKDTADLGPLPADEGLRLKEVRIKPGHDDPVLEAVLEMMDGKGNMRGRLTGLSQEDLLRRLKECRSQEYRVAAVDPGVDNFCAVTNNFGAGPFLIRGGVIKSENRYYNKKLAELKADAMRCSGMHSTRRIRRLTGRRNRILKDLMHKASRQLCRWAEENRADVIVLGHNVFQKQGIETGHVNNQNFVQIPYAVFAGMLKYKLEEKGIAFLETEESYTSRADFLAGDRMPVYGMEKKNNEKAPHFSGKRVRRGLYCHSDGTKSNADINGAANIMRKVFPNVTEWDRCVVDTPYAVRIA